MFSLYFLKRSSALKARFLVEVNTNSCCSIYKPQKEDCYELEVICTDTEHFEHTLLLSLLFILLEKEHRQRPEFFAKRHFTRYVKKAPLKSPCAYAETQPPPPHTRPYSTSERSAQKQQLFSHIKHPDILVSLYIADL